MGEGVRAALDRLAAALAATPFDIDAAGAALHAVREAWPAAPEAEDLRRMVALCYRVTGLDGAPPPISLDGWPGQGLWWAAKGLIEGLLVDEGARNRDFVRHTITRSRAFGRPVPEGARAEPVPLPHVPVSATEAAALVAPWLAALRERLEDDPHAHLDLCWKALEMPVPPFDRVIEAWLDALDREGAAGSGSGQALRRAMALAALAEEGLQKLTWETCVAELLPQLGDPHPLVAACAARYLGHLYSDPERNIVRSTPEPLTDALDRLARLPRNRRAAAGGFLHGFDADMGGPIHALRAALEGTEYDVEDWVLAVFADRTPEPYLPGAQAFWFHVHETYDHDPAFVARLADAGHAWEAMMCATEARMEVEGMAPVLRRLAAVEDPEVARPARDHLARHYPAGAGFGA